MAREQAGPAVYHVPHAVMDEIYETLKFYANLCNYQGERTGGVLAGCPRGPTPTPDDLIAHAQKALKMIDRSVLGRAEKETKSAPDNSGVCPVCGWPTGHCNVGCTAAAGQCIKVGDRVRLAIGTNTMLPTEGWTVYKLPTPEWRSYGLKHDNGGDMSINGEYVVPV